MSLKSLDDIVFRRPKQAKEKEAAREDLRDVGLCQLKTLFHVATVKQRLGFIVLVRVDPPVLVRFGHGELTETSVSREWGCRLAVEKLFKQD